MCLLWEWEKWEIKDLQRFILRCICKDLIPVSVRHKSTSNRRSRRAKEIIHRAEKQLLQDRAKGINGILCENTIKLDRCRSRLLSLVTTTMGKCTDFINKVGEVRFIKIRDRQINKFNRLMGNKDGNLPHNPVANNNQSQAQNNSNKWIVDLAPPIPVTRISFVQRTKLCSSPKPPSGIHHFYRVTLPEVRSP